MRVINFLVLTSAISFIASTQVMQVWPQSSSDQNRDVSIVTDRPSQLVAPVIPRSYALVVGVAHYLNLPARAQLQFADRDAESIYTTLISAEGGQFPPENVHRLINEKATLQSLRYELEEWLPSVTKPDDRVLIYFAGHGLISAGKAYLGPYDLDPLHITATAYSMEDLGKLVGSRIQGKWKVLLTDACHSGALTPETDAVQVNQRLLDLNKSMFSLTASRDREQSFEGPKWNGGHGVFTYFVVKGLEGEADNSGDGIVTADELAEYVHTNVRLATEMRQNPTSDRGSFDPNMVLAYNPAQGRVSRATMQKYGAMVIESNMDGTEVWVDSKEGGKVDRGKPLRLDGLLPGPHTVKGVHAGYEPDGPREEQVYPGQDTTVSLRLLIPRHHSRAAQEPFDRGVDYYNRGYEVNYRRAINEFQHALALDPQDSHAALFLGRAYSGLYDMENARASMQRAIEIDPDYDEARTSYAAVLLDIGNFDEAVRQLDLVTRRQCDNGMAWYLLSQAYVRKASYGQAIEAARHAVRLTPSNAEAHLWLAEALRLNSSASEAEIEYKQYLSHSDFDSNALGKINYYVLGSVFGMGTKKRAAQADIWREQRAQAKLGICDCEWMQGRLETAEQFCLEASSLQGDDMFTNYRLGLIEAELYNARGSVALLEAARKHFGSVVTTDPDTAEAKRARQYLANIDVVLQKQK